MTSPRPAKLEGYREAAVAQAYDRRWTGARGARRDARKRRTLIRALDCLRQQARGTWQGQLVDIPCGTGRFSDLTAPNASTILGLDLSREMLLEAQAKHPEASYAVADLARLPLADDAVDAAFCIRLFHLVHEREWRLRFLRELARVSRHGFVIDYRHGRSLRSWGRRWRHRLNPAVETSHNPSPAAIRGELREAGLRPLAWLPVHHAPLLSDKVLIPCVRLQP